jgi:hypothetical protein
MNDVFFTIKLMNESVFFSNTSISSLNVFEAIHNLPHAVYELKLQNVNFESLDCLHLFINGLHNRTIEQIIVDNCVITHAQLIQIISMLELLKTTKLVLVNMDLEDRICESISMFGNRLKYLDLSNNKITNKGLEMLLVLKLNFLDISNNPIYAFVEWNLLFNNCKGIRLNGCFYNEEHFLKFCDIINDRQWKMEHLDLSNNNLTSYSVARLLYVSSEIHSLYLCDNMIDDRIIDVLMNSKHIQNIYLDRNIYITNEGIKKIVTLYTLSALRHISIRGCQVDITLMMKLEKMNRYHRSVHNVESLISKLPINFSLQQRMREFL